MSRWKCRTAMRVRRERIDEGAMRGTFWIVFLALISIANGASAVCLEGRHPSVKAEYAASEIVAVGKVISKKDISAPDDPGGIEKTIYSFKVVRGYKFIRPNTILEITSENTTSRFEMDPGTDYLVFLERAGGESFVDSCGHSGEARKRRNVIQQLRRLNRH